MATLLEETQTRLMALSFEYEILLAKCNRMYPHVPPKVMKLIEAEFEESGRRWGDPMLHPAEIIPNPKRIEKDA